MYCNFGKRLFDILLVCVAVILLSPLMVIISILIKLFDPGPVFFVQRRVGKGGRTFSFYKFRSMPVNTGDLASDELKKVELTWLGKLIRRTNVDELPQLLNIVKGDMSIVGPRPPISSQCKLLAIRRNNGSLDCRPGLTGLAQINSYDGMPVARKAEFDGVYAKNITLIKDLKIILGTFTYLLKPPPVY